MMINSNKCELKFDKISYSRYQISKKGITPDDKLTDEILHWVEIDVTSKSSQNGNQT